MARERVVKYPPKRGKLNRREVERVVREVVYARRGIEVPKKTRKRRITTIEVGRDAKTGRFISRAEAKRPTDTVVIETIKIPKKKR